MLTEGKISAQQIVTEDEDCQFDSQTHILHRSVLILSHTKLGVNALPGTMSPCKKKGVRIQDHIKMICHKVQSLTEQKPVSPLDLI